MALAYSAVLALPPKSPVRAWGYSQHFKIRHVRISRTHLSVSEGVEGSLLDASSMLIQTHVLQHHDRAEQEGSGVGKTLPSNIRGRAVDSLED